MISSIFSANSSKFLSHSVYNHQHLHLHLFLFVIVNFSSVGNFPLSVSYVPWALGHGIVSIQHFFHRENRSMGVWQSRTGIYAYLFTWVLFALHISNSTCVYGISLVSWFILDDLIPSIIVLSARKVSYFSFVQWLACFIGQTVSFLAPILTWISSHLECITILAPASIACAHSVAYTEGPQ